MAYIHRLCMLVLLSGTVLFVCALHVGIKLHIEHERKKAEFTGAVNSVISYSHTVSHGKGGYAYRK